MATRVSHLYTVIPSRKFPLLILRTIKASDYERFYAILTAPSNSINPNSGEMSLESAGPTIDRCLESASEPTVTDSHGNVIRGPDRVNMMLVLKPEPGSVEKERIIGLGGFGAIRRRFRDNRWVRSGDASIIMDPAYKRLGYGTEAMKMAIDWGFTPASEGGPQLDRVTIRPLEGNEPMRKLVDEKLGLQNMGVVREFDFEEVNKFSDDEGKMEVFYELTKDQWDDITLQQLQFQYE